MNLVGNLNDLRSLILCWNGNFLYRGIDPSESLRLSLTSTSCFSSDTSLGPRVFDRLTFIASFILTFGLAPEVILMKTHSVFVSLSVENVKKICKFSVENSGVVFKNFYTYTHQMHQGFTWNDNFWVEVFHFKGHNLIGRTGQSGGLRTNYCRVITTFFFQSSMMAR